MFFIRLVLATGLRVGELCALKWSDIDFQRHTVKISRTLQRVMKCKEKIGDKNSTTILEGSVKTNNGYREIPLIDSVFNILMVHLEQQNAEKQMYGIAYFDNGYIFAGPLGTFVEPSLMHDICYLTSKTINM